MKKPENSEKDDLQKVLFRRAAAMRSMRIRKETIRAYKADDVDLLRIYEGTLYRASDLKVILRNVGIARLHIGGEVAPFITTESMAARASLDSTIQSSNRPFGIPVDQRDEITVLALLYPEQIENLKSIVADRGMVHADSIREVLTNMELSNPMLLEGAL